MMTTAVERDEIERNEGECEPTTANASMKLAETLQYHHTRHADGIEKKRVKIDSNEIYKTTRCGIQVADCNITYVSAFLSYGRYS